MLPLLALVGVPMAGVWFACCLALLLSVYGASRRRR